VNLNPEDFLSDLDALVDDWCDCRNLHELKLVLPSYLAFDGSDAALGDLRGALKSIAEEYGRHLTAEGYQHVKHLLEVSGEALQH
jgi:hypothetical protein